MALTDENPGFLNQYSTTAVYEDKAEMFANMVTNMEYVQQRAATDKVIRAKMRQMKALLVEFCPTADESFWLRATRLPR